MSLNPLKKNLSKDEREKQVLIGLIELFINTGKPIGSQTLQDCGFEHLSSATIRNYFSKLEKEGLLVQHHSSGGRIPTSAAFRLFAKHCQEIGRLNTKDAKFLKERLQSDTKEVISYLQKAAETISELTQCAVFLSSARFDQDFVTDLKLLPIDENRCLSVLITDFGLVHTEILRMEKKITEQGLHKIETFFRYKLLREDEQGVAPPDLSEEEENLAKSFYNEIMLRYIVSHSHFSHADIYKTGFSRLLSYEDFSDVTTLAGALSLFENDDHLRTILSDTQRLQTVTSWLGDDLSQFIPETDVVSVITIPYKIHQNVAGSFGLMGPLRIPYKRLFAILKTASSMITESLTKSVYKHKISFRRPSLGISHVAKSGLENSRLALPESQPPKESL